jgi:transcriptional regulator with XRE-family HTH domain
MDGHTDTTPSLAVALRDALAGRPQIDVAAEMGVSQSRLSRWLQGEPPADDKVPTLARYLKVSESDVLHMIYRARTTGRPTKGDVSSRLDSLERQVDHLTELLEQLVAERKPSPARRRKSS